MSKIAWNDVDWTIVQKRISRQQRRVYKASKAGNKTVVQALQRRIIGSLDAKLLAVRQLTTRNIWCNNAGVETISHNKKIELAYQLKLTGNISSLTKTYIPKFEKRKYYPFNIPNYAKQMLTKFALEPEWEAIFESNSYGSRPGKSCNDAISALFRLLKEKYQYVLRANVQKCFGSIDHNKLLNKLATFTQMENQVKIWLKIGIMGDYSERSNEVFRSIEGTPTYGVIAPLLINIALHGLENYIKDWYINNLCTSTRPNFKLTKQERKLTIGFSRYVDDFVITAPKREDIIQIESEISKWLNDKVGLQLSKVKKRIVNSTEGFEFLGFQIISIKNQEKRIQTIKIHPSRASKVIIVQRIRKSIQKNRSASSYSLIKLLSRQIIGWANYFRYSKCIQDFNKIDYLIFNQIRTWVFRRKSNGLRARTKLKLKYFPEGGTYRFRGKDYKNNWILRGETLIKGKIKENYLPKMIWIQPGQHFKIRGNASPYDDNNLYWDKRRKISDENPNVI